MKALEQNYRNGALQLVEIPAPRPTPGYITVSTSASLASVGTERGMIELARKSLLGKALARPDLVQQVWLKARAEGPLEAWRQAWGRLNVPILLGYSSAGEVIEVGPGVSAFRAGDRVACAGSGVAGHVEIALAPVNLCTPIPEGVTHEEASFVAIGGIALEAIRSGRVTFGDRVVVIGLGLIGQLVVRLLRVAGCHVFGIDRDQRKNELALGSGAEAIALAADARSVAGQVNAWSQGFGADAVIITAATQSNEPLELAADVSRERGRVVVTGVVGMQVPRRTFYEKELELVVSRAWGPGLYDPAYAQRGLDYPIAYARWTAQRNMAEFLAQLARGAVSVGDLITHRFPIDEAPQAYEMILAGKEQCIGVVIQYPAHSHPSTGSGRSPSLVSSRERPEREASPAPTPPPFRGGGLEGPLPSGKGKGEGVSDRVVWLRKAAPSKPRPTGQIGIGVIGAGQFASGTVLPLLKRLPGASLRGIASRTGLSGRTAGVRYGFEYCTSDYQELLVDPRVDLVLVLTRHDSHAALATAALAAGKHVFVEKPLAVDSEQLRTVVEAYETAHPPTYSNTSPPYKGEGRGEGLLTGAPTPTPPPSRVGGSNAPPVLMVGFNRRFSPHAKWIKERLRQVSAPLSLSCIVNAGPLDPDSWLADKATGGGRIIGEVCHFVDLAQYLTGSRPVRAFAQRVGDRAAPADDSVSCTLTMANGSIVHIGYFATGDKAHPRERVEIFGGGAVGLIDNFKAARFVKGGRSQSRRSLLAVDRGHRTELEALLGAVRAGSALTLPLSGGERAYEIGVRAELVPFEDYVATTLTTFALERSLATGQPEKISPA
ncbi:MAG: Gfo/Idh/MocA family oxidoreductase [Chloroflexi bacterium]|nr:Gfo/Idh/MocA family oxidoreductase [Chloroflexota bacterium]